MNLAKFKKLHKLFSNLPLTQKQTNSSDYKKYEKALLNNKECYEWDITLRVKQAGIKPKNYCCIDMAYHLIEDKKGKSSRKINYDSVIVQTSSKKIFGLPIHDGGTSFIKIKYCPWCGSKLKKGKRN